MTDVPERMDCPTCHSEVYVLDGVCSSCGQLICPRCATALDEDAEFCTNCKLPLLFDCPQCGFELLSAATACPDCGRSFLRICPDCGQTVFGAALVCGNCGRKLHLEGARSLPWWMWRAWCPW